jgi:hypothetical protein
MAPLKLIRSGKMADRSGNRKVTKHMARKHVRSDGMVLEFDEIVPEEGADMEKGNGKRKAHHYAFRRRRLGHNGRRLRFRADDDGWVTVMKGAKRDAERKITMPVYSATYSGKGINHRTNARSMSRQRNDAAQYDRKREEAEGWGRQFISARCRFVVDLGEKMSGDALNAGFQFARSKVPDEKAWRNTYDQVQADWGTHKSLSMKWARLLLRRVRSLWQPVVVNDMLGYVSTVPGIRFGTGLFVVWTKRMSGPVRFDPPGRYCQWQEPIECRRPPRFQKLHHAEVNRKAIGAAEASSIESQQVIEARGFGMLRQPGEYLWSPSKRQLADERAGRGWRLRQIQPAQVQDSMASATEQVVEISPGVYVAYPTRWLRTLTRPDYVTVTLINGSVERYCQYEMERETLDTASGGCHVRMPTHGSSQAVMLGEQVSATIAVPSVEMDDEMPPLVASDSECDDDDDENESYRGYSWRSQLGVRYLPIWSRSQVHLTIGSGAVRPTDGNAGDDQGSDDDGYSGDDQGSADAADSGDDDCKESIRDDGHQRIVFLEPLNSAEILAREIDEFVLPLVAEEQDMAGNNMDFHKSRDETPRLVSNDNTGVLESEQKAQDIRKEDLKRAAMQEHKRREKNAQVLRCNSEELKVLALRQRRNRESIAEVIKHQSTPDVDSEASNRAQEASPRRAQNERAS